MEKGGLETRGQITLDRIQRTGDQEQKQKTGDSGREARNRGLRQGKEDGRQGTET
jgi:hypothetical protein